MLTGGLMGSAHAPTVSVIALVSDADKWPNAGCSFSQFFIDSFGAMLLNGLMNRAHTLSCAVVVTS